MTPYTYLIGWSKLNTYYYGVRYAKGCNPSDLWKTYFTSSKYVKEFHKQYGNPDIIQVRKIFKSKEHAILWEHKVLRKLNVINDDRFLNKTDNKSIVNTKETNQKTAQRMKILKTGTKNPKLSKLNKLKIGTKNPAKRNEVRKKISELKSGAGNAMYGKKGNLHPRWNKIGAASGKRWYYNKITKESKYFIENQQPKDFILGRKEKE